MKLLYVCSDFGIQPAGVKGASVHLRSITRALCELGHRVTLLSPHAGPENGHPATTLPLDGLHPVDPVRRVRRWLKDRDLPTDVADDLRYLFFNEWAVSRAVDALAPDPPDTIIERLSLFGHLGLDLSRRFDVPLIVEVNALLSREAHKFRNLGLVTLAEEVERRVLTQADAVITVSDELKDALRRTGCDRPDVCVVPNGTNVERFHTTDNGGRAVRDELGLGDAFVVGFVGSLKPWHGVDVLLSAYARLRNEDANARLLIVGTGPMERALRAAARNSVRPSGGCEELAVFTGAVPHERIPDYLAAMDVAAAPFRAMEDFYFSPIKLFEYMAAGRCIVASRLGQMETVIRHGENGLLCPPDDDRALADVLVGVRRDPEMRLRLGRAARLCARRHHTWRHSAERTMEIVRAQVERRGHGTPPRAKTASGGEVVSGSASGICPS